MYGVKKVVVENERYVLEEDVVMLEASGKKQLIT